MTKKWNIPRPSPFGLFKTRKQLEADIKPRLLYLIKQAEAVQDGELRASIVNNIKLFMENLDIYEDKELYKQWILHMRLQTEFIQIGIHGIENVKIDDWADDYYWYGQ